MYFNEIYAVRRSGRQWYVVSLVFVFASLSGLSLVSLFGTYLRVLPPDRTRSGQRDNLLVGIAKSMSMKQGQRQDRRFPLL